MYGTVARMQIRPGAEPQLMALSEAYAATTVPGYVGAYLYRMDNEPNTYFMAVIFESREAYHANASTPTQDRLYHQMLSGLEEPPVWHDGEIVSHRTASDAAR